MVTSPEPIRDDPKEHVTTMRRAAMRAAGAVLILAALVPALISCESSDPVAPADSTITVSANPQTVIVPSGGGAGATQITATLRSKNGTRLPNQEISFTTTAGTLDPPADTFLETDDDGQARSILITSSSATVTARSGSITGQTQVQTAPGDLAQFILNVSPDFLSSCNDQLEVEVQVRTTSGDPAPGVLVILSTSGGLTGSFNPTQTNSDAAGLVTAIYSPPNDCEQKCSLVTDPNSPTGGDCTFFIEASDLTHTFDAVPFQIDDQIP